MINPEKKLWQNVLLTAINDALNLSKVSNTTYGIKIAEDAKNWLLNNNTHYYRVCSMANINPESLRKKIKEKLFVKNDNIANENNLDLSWEMDLSGDESKELNL